MSDIVNDLGATKDEDDQIKASACGHCDFSMGTRGMDRCSKCDGSGSLLRVGTEIFPNTREGYKKALAKVRSLP